jgi:CBS domain-containing protein
MTTSNDDDTAATDLPIHTRTVVGSDPGAVRRVSCPRRGHSVPLATCLQCEHCGEVSLRRSGESSFLRCTAGPEPSEPTANGEPDWTPISSVMPTMLVCVRPELDVEALTRLFVEHGINAAPVVDEEGRAVGVVSKTDLLRFKHEEAGDCAEQASPQGCDWCSVGLEQGFHIEPVAEGKVMDIMTPVAFTLSESASLARAAALMVFEGIHQVPVTGIQQEVVGMISSLDILRWFARKAGYVLAGS